MNKIVVITGATSGIGEELKRLYNLNGDTVINLSYDVKEEDLLNFRLDVSKREDVFDVFEKIHSHYNRIDVLVNCAGYGVFGATEVLSKAECEKIIDVNFFGVLWCSQACIKYMQKGSRIINISSACALFELPYRTMYCASKSAVNSLTFGMRMELRQFGIDVVSICPGDIKTNFSKNRVIEINENDKYAKALNESIGVIGKKESARMDRAKAVKKIYKICNKRKSKPMYIIGRKYKFLNFLKKIFGLKVWLHFTYKMF